MTTDSSVAQTGRKAAGGSEFRALLKIATRGLRGGISGFAVFIACIALGVAAVVGVGSVSRGFSDGLADQSRTILGGDAAFSVMHQPLDPAAVAWLQSKGSVAVVADMRAMARAVDGAGTALIDLKVVDGGWPSLGVATVRPERPVQSLLAKSDGEYGMIADPALAARLGLKLGDRLKIGDEVFQLRGSLISEPDGLASGFTLGPRVIIAQSALGSTDLLQPGALVRWTYRVNLSRFDPGGAEPDAAAFVDRANAAFPGAGWETRTRNDVSPQFSQSSKQLTQFLTLVALTALMIGGIGVANASRAYVERGMKDFATLKAIGASGGAVFAIALMQIMVVAALGSAAGLLLGAAIPFALAAGLDEVVKIPFQAELYPRQLALGGLYGLVSAFAFSVGPLGRAHDAPVAALFRSRLEGGIGWPRARYAVMSGAAFLALFAAVIASAADRRIVEVYVGAAAIAVATLRALAWCLEATARRLPKFGSVELRFALANLHRPGALTPTIVMSLGLGLALLTSIALVDGNLRSEIGQATPGLTPSLFFLDVPTVENAAFRDFLHREAPNAIFDEAPMLRGRVVALNGEAPSEANTASSAAWVLNSDRGLTYSATPPTATRLVAGSWWPANYAGAPLVSVDAGVARGLRLHVGDSISVNALGHIVTARIANLRDVDWRSLGINFVFVFSPNALQDAPHTILATATFLGNAPRDADLALLREVANAFPAVSVVRVKDAIDAADALLDKVALAIRSASAVVLAAAALVLAGAVASGQKNRTYDAVVLKTIGATRKQLLSALAIEYLVLGLAAATVGVATGGVAAYIVLTDILNVARFDWLWAPLLTSVAVGLFVAVSLGLSLTARALGRKPSTLLRDD